MTKTIYKFSEKGIKHLKKFEGEKLTAYPDIGGIWTIGVGHTGVVYGKPVCRGMTITPEKSSQLLLNDVAQFERIINEKVSVELKQHQFDALICLIYNIGAGNFSKSTLLRELNKGNYGAAAEQFLVWNKAGGKFVQGLLNRRQQEKAMFEGALS